MGRGTEHYLGEAGHALPARAVRRRACDVEGEV